VIICAGEIEQFVFARAVGIGMVDTAINLTKICIEQRPDEICFVGSAGSYGFHQIFDIIESSRAVNLENSFFNAQAYSPIEHNVSCETIDNDIIVNSSNYITTDSSLAEAYLEKNIYLENMEFYAVMKVSQVFDIPCRGIFVITNHCDTDAHEAFLKNHPEAMKRLTEYINPNNAIEITNLPQNIDNSIA
jgi:nucleoside phosphorylase